MNEGFIAPNGDTLMQEMYQNEKHRIVITRVNNGDQTSLTVYCFESNYIARFEGSLGEYVCGCGWHFRLPEALVMMKVLDE